MVIEVKRSTFEGEAPDVKDASTKVKKRLTSVVLWSSKGARDRPSMAVDAASAAAVAVLCAQ